MQKEEKQLENAVDKLIQRVQDLKNSIAAFLFKLENEYQTLHWPSVLDNFALLSGQLSMLGKLLKHESVPPLRNCVLLPLVLSHERDQELEKLTERRIYAFNHEVVPDYLRTKPEPEVEEKVQSVCNKASSVSNEVAQRQINAMNKLTSNILDIINSHKDSMESEANQKAPLAQSSSQTDTSTLIAAALTGKGLKSTRRPDMAQQQGNSQSQQQQQQQQQAQQKNQASVVGKAQSTMKSNMKQSSGSHPYQR